MKDLAKNLRKDILKVSCTAQAGHIPSAFSILETILVLYKKVLQDDDVFVLSKGHGCLALYAVFFEMGFITKEEFNSFCQYDSKLGGHPHRKKMKEISSSTGSLGHGLPMCVGSALAKKIQQKPGRVFCLIGDGECNEGTIWESAMVAQSLSLSNLVCVVDQNNSQSRSLPLKNIGEKFRSFGWKITEVYDGHDMEKILESLIIPRVSSFGPTCVVCHTIKGKGIKEMEDNMFAWHHGPPSSDQYKKFCEELDA